MQWNVVRDLLLVCVITVLLGLSAQTAEGGLRIAVPVADDADPYYVVTPGTGLDGVCMVGGGGSGALLWTGRHVLTAAHLFDNLSTYKRLEENTCIFNTASGTKEIAFKALWIAPGYMENMSDIAIVELAEEAPADAERYVIYRQKDEVGKVFIKAGYGLRGTGLHGEIPYSYGILRYGKNRYDMVVDASLTSTVENPDDAPWLLFDFDDGTPAYDAFGNAFDLTDTGLGIDEVNTTHGDSGGPGFVEQEGELRIASITSGGFSFSDESPSSDGDVCCSSSFGEYSVETRVSAFADWIDQIIADSANPDKAQYTRSLSISVLLNGKTYDEERDGYLSLQLYAGKSKDKQYYIGTVYSYSYSDGAFHISLPMRSGFLGPGYYLRIGGSGMDVIEPVEPVQIPEGTDWSLDCVMQYALGIQVFPPKAYDTECAGYFHGYNDAFYDSVVPGYAGGFEVGLECYQLELEDEDAIDDAYYEHYEDYDFEFDDTWGENYNDTPEIQTGLEIYRENYAAGYEDGLQDGYCNGYDMGFEEGLANATYDASLSRFECEDDDVCNLVEVVKVVVCMPAYVDVSPEIDVYVVVFLPNGEFVCVADNNTVSSLNDIVPCRTHLLATAVIRETVATIPYAYEAFDATLTEQPLFIVIAKSGVALTDGGAILDVAEGFWWPVSM